MRIRLRLPAVGLLLGAGLLVASCGTAEEVQHSDPPKRLNEKEAVELLFEKGKIPFHCFYSKVGIDFTDKSSSNSFTATFKMRVDSAFSGTLSKGPVIGATYLVTKDSVFFSNKLKDCYFKENFAYLTGIFGTAIEYKFFESLVLGLPLALDKEIKYTYKHMRDFYVLSSYKKKDLRKIDADEEKEVFVEYFINTTSLNLDRIAIQVPEDTVSIDINYQERADYEGFMLPTKTQIKIIHPQDSIFIDLDFGSVKINDCREIGINIPESYVKCKND